MSGYNDIHRAARDPHYRMMYEHQQRQESLSRQIAQIRAATSSSSSSQSSAGDGFSFTPSSSSYSSSGAGASGGGGEAAAVFMGCAILGGFAVTAFSMYGGIILKWTVIGAVCVAAGWFLMKHRPRLPLWAAVPVTWAGWLGMVMLLASGTKMPETTAAIAGCIAATGLGAAIWPRRDGGLRERIPDVLIWVLPLALIVPVAEFTHWFAIARWGSQAGYWISMCTGFAVAALFGGALQLVRRRFAHRP